MKPVTDIDGDDCMALVNLSVVDDSSAALYSLFDWLQRVDELRGRIAAPSRQAESHEMGGVVEVLTVALGSGGAGAVLAGALSTWLQTRRARIVVELVTGESSRRVEVDGGSAVVVERLYELLKTDGQNR